MGSFEDRRTEERRSTRTGKKEGRKEKGRTERKEVNEGVRMDSRGGGEDLFLWWKLMSIQIEDHLLLAEVQQEADGIS